MFTIKPADDHHFASMGFGNVTPSTSSKALQRQGTIVGSSVTAAFDRSNRNHDNNNADGKSGGSETVVLTGELGSLTQRAEIAFSDGKTFWKPTLETMQNFNEWYKLQSKVLLLFLCV